MGVVRGAALYVGALIGPGVLLVPALAAQAAGPASVLAWAALLVLSAPLAITFAALGVRHPVAGGVAAYVRAGLGDAAASVTGAWFMTAILIGGPAVSLIGGYYVADLTDSGTSVAVVVGLLMFGAVLAANAFGLRVSSGFQLGLSAVLVVVIASAVGIAVPSRGGDNWTPFAPHGWWAVGDAASILIWLFIGWEAMAQLAGEFRRPERDLPRAMALAFGVVTALYVGLAVATIAVTAGSGSKVPLADLVAVGFGRAGRDATAVLAVALTMGTMNVYTAGAAKLAAALAQDGDAAAVARGRCDAEHSAATVARARARRIGRPSGARRGLQQHGFAHSRHVRVLRRRLPAVAHFRRAHPCRTHPPCRNRLARSRRGGGDLLAGVPPRACRRGDGRPRRPARRAAACQTPRSDIS